MLRRCLDWTFRDRGTGCITVAQWPNPPLWAFIAASATGAAAGPDTTLGRWTAVVAAASLFVWAAEELLLGVNPWRRLLGAGVLAWQAVGLLR